MSDHTYYMESENDNNTLSFASPLTQGPKTYAYRVTTVIVEDFAVSSMRADYSVWERDPNNAGHWDLTDDEPGIVALLTDENDEPCADCNDELAPYYNEEWEHEDDCPTRYEDDGALDGHEGYWCCFAERDAAYEAHRLYKAEHEDDSCSLAPDFVLLDGGDVLCRYHVAEWFNARWLWIGNDYGAPNRERMLRDYFQARRRVADSENPKVAALPSTNVLYQLASLQRARVDLDEAERTRRRRDDDIGALRDDLSTETVAFWSGESTSRIHPINADHEQTKRVFWARVEAEHAAKKANEEQNAEDSSS